MEKVKEKEFYTKQQATFRNCDWVVYLTMEQIKALEKGKTNKGRYMSFYFETATKSHGFEHYHRAFSAAYVDAMMVMLKNGLGYEEWKVIQYGRVPAPIAKLEMENSKFGYSKFAR